MRKILLLGGSGLLGSAILNRADESKIIITAPTRDQFEAGVDDTDEFLSQYQDYDCIINCIAYHNVDVCEDNVEQTFKINEDFVQKLAQFCNNTNKTFIHISTDYVFDGKLMRPYKEDDLTNPVNIYGKSKLAGEERIKAIGGKYFICRVASLFGFKNEESTNNSFVKKILAKATQNQPLRIVDDQIMTPTYTREIADAIYKLILSDNQEYGIYHLCNTGACSWYQLAQEIFRIKGLNPDLTAVKYSEFPARADRPLYSAMDNSKISKIFKMSTWQDALNSYLNANE